MKKSQKRSWKLHLTSKQALYTLNVVCFAVVAAGWINARQEGVIASGGVQPGQTIPFAVLVVVTTLVALQLPIAVAEIATARSPRPIDPSNPPYGVVMVRAEGDPQTRCACHGRRIADGQEVTCWPRPPQFLCQKGDSK